MHKKHKYDIISLLAVVALGVSLYLSITHYLGYAVPCSVTHGCETVLNSKYSVVWGVPLSVLGVVFFFSVFVSSLLANHYVFFKKLLTVLLSIGSLASLVFLSLQFFVIKKICEYCFTTDSLTIIMLLLDINIEHRND